MNNEKEKRDLLARAIEDLTEVHTLSASLRNVIDQLRDPHGNRDAALIELGVIYERLNVLECRTGDVIREYNERESERYADFSSDWKNLLKDRWENLCKSPDGAQYFNSREKGFYIRSYNMPPKIDVCVKKRGRPAGAKNKIQKKKVEKSAPAPEVKDVDIPNDEASQK